MAKFIVVHSVKVATDFVPETFGRLTTIGPRFLLRKSSKKHRAYQVCQCKCGSIVVVVTSELVSSGTKSCGCQRGIAAGNRVYGKAKPKSPNYSIVPGNCGRCGIAFHGKSWQKYCSEKCSSEQQEANNKGDQWVIFNRDGFACVYCGRHTDEVELRCDHIIPVSAGGVDTADNLVTACDRCNASKHNSPLSPEGAYYVHGQVSKRNQENGILPDKIIKGSHSAEKRNRHRPSK